MSRFVDPEVQIGEVLVEPIGPLRVDECVAARPQHDRRRRDAIAAVGTCSWRDCAPKAEEAARICADGTITWKPRHGRFQDSPGHPTLLISAVDTNRAREALQQQYVPRILSASTSEVRAEVLRIGPPGIGACLRCYHPPEALIADDDLRQRSLAAGPAALDALAAEVGVERTDVERELNRSRCSEVGDRLLTVLRRDHPLAEPRFAVGFTSALAGTLLAAETVKIQMNTPMQPSDPRCNNVTFQFLKPQSTVNEARRLLAEPGCPGLLPNQRRYRCVAGPRRTDRSGY